MSKEAILPTKVLILVNGTSTDNDVIKIACNMTEVTGGDIYAIYVIELKRSLPLEAEVESEIQKGESVLDHAERLAEQLGGSMETFLLQARDKGPAIVEEAVERDVDIILVGMTYEKPHGEYQISDMVPYLLKWAPCRVLILREPIPVERED
jgi:K+-sensing histidine kinase KdpD